MMKRLLSITLLLVMVLGYGILSTSAANPKITFNNLGHSGKPDLKALYGIALLPSYSRNSITGFATTWPDATNVPTAQWYTDFAAQVSTPVDHWLMLDLESFDVSTQAARIATSAKFVTIYQGLKAVLPSTVKVAFYSYPVVNDFFNAIDDPSSGTYQTWQAKNTDFATMAAVVDGYMPKLYMPFGADPGVPSGGTNYAYLYFHAQIQEAKRLRSTYGRADQGIYPFVYWRMAADQTEVPRWVYSLMTSTAYTEGDGLTLFGGSTHAWTDPTYGGVAWWFVNFLDQWPFGNRGLLQSRTAVGGDLLASDAFDDDGATLGSNWSNNSTVSVLKRVSGVTVPTDINNDAAARYSALTWPNDQRSLVIHNTVVPSGLGSGFGPAVRMSTSGTTVSYDRFICNGAGWELGENVNGVFTSLASSTIPVCTDGGQSSLEVQGTTLRAWIGTTLVATKTSTLTSGAAGIAFSSPGGNNTRGITNWYGYSAGIARRPRQ